MRSISGESNGEPLVLALSLSPASLRKRVGCWSAYWDLAFSCPTIQKNCSPYREVDELEISIRQERMVHASKGNRIKAGPGDDGVIARLRDVEIGET